MLKRLAVIAWNLALASLWSLLSFLVKEKKLEDPRPCSLQTCEQASASTSGAAPDQRKPDVFVNFRGEDTRNNFISHLGRETKRNGIFAFTDEGLRGGDDISTTLAEKISDSPVAVVVFSPNYADSRWCLDELVHIIQCMKVRDGRKVLPVFLQGVKPTHVRHQTGPFGDGFKRLIQTGQYYNKKDGWIDSLKQTADFSSGAYDHSSEAEIIDKLIRRILSILGKMGSHDYGKGYFGRHSIDQVKARLSSQDVSSIGIWGMGGLGKTTLARKVFSHISNNFHRACFLENVQKRVERQEVDRLQDYLLSQFLGKAPPHEPQHTINNNQTKFVLSRISVLIVLDDVSDVGQIEKVIGDWRNYGTGSKLIVTSRNKQVLENVCNNIYELKTLGNSDSLRLLQHHMLKQRQPTDEQMELLQEIIRYAKGLPLALEVLGRNLYNKNITIWKSELEKLNIVPDGGIIEILRSSFDGLDEMEKSIFLDIACLLHWWDGNKEEIVLGACAFFPESSRERLIDKALIRIDFDGKLHMHSLLQQMGDEIGKDCRIWRRKEIVNVLSKDLGSNRKKHIEVISSELSVTNKIKLKHNVFEKMQRLRILRLANHYAETILLPQGLEYLPDELRYLEWFGYPLTSLPQRFDPENLVELHMQCSSLSQLWSGKPHLPNLKCIDLKYSFHLRELPDLSGALRLEILDIFTCEMIQDIPDSIKLLVELKLLNLACTGLTGCPELSQLTQLEHLDFSGCWKITELPQLPENLIHLNVSKTKIKELPQGIEHMSLLKQLQCQGCKELESLPSNIGNLKQLLLLDISECWKLRSLPTSVGDLCSLEKLIASYSSLTFLPEEIKFLAHLKELALDSCINLGSVPDGIEGLSNMNTLNLSNCTNLKSLPNGIGSSLPLLALKLSGCTNLEILPEDIKELGDLYELDLSNCTKLERIPEGIDGLANLEELRLSNCTSLRSLPDGLVDLADLTLLDLSNCTNLESLPKDIGNLLYLATLKLSGCTHLESLPESIKELGYLHELDLSNCTNLKRLPDGIKGLACLKELHLSNCTMGSLPDGIEDLAYLVKLDLSFCTNLESLPESIKGLAYLEELLLSSCTNLASLPEGIEGLANLKILHLSNCTNLKRIPDGIKGLACLKELHLFNCTNLGSLPDGIEDLTYLEKLDLSFCTNLESLPESIKGLAYLEELLLFTCTNLASLPEGIEGLANLKILTLSNCTKLKRIPDGIESLTKLRKLCLSSCTSLESLPERIKHLTHLEVLELSNCRSLIKIPEVPCRLESLDASDCTSLVNYTHMSLSDPRWKFSFRFWNCISLEADARNHILRDFRRAVSGLALKMNLKDIGCDKAELWLPGSELPADWFNNCVEMGCQLPVKTTWRRVAATSWVALIFGVVLNIASSPTPPNSCESHLLVICKWPSESGEELWSKCAITYLASGIPGEHIVLWLNFVDPSKFCFPETVFQFSVYGDDPSRRMTMLRADAEILKCGVTLTSDCY